MSCQKHIQRKRPNTCPDCAAELKATLPKEEEKVPVVIKEKKKEEPKPIENKKPLLTPTSLPLQLDDDLINLDSQIRKVKEDLEQYCKFLIEKIRAEARSITEVTYEYEYVRETGFKIDLLDKKAKEGWRFKEILSGKIAELYGFKETVTVFERVKKK